MGWFAWSFIFICIFQSCNDDKMEHQPDTPITEGPLNGRMAIWDKQLRAFIVEGDDSKASALVEYVPTACTSGIQSRVCPIEQTAFKALSLGQGDTPLRDDFTIQNGSGFISKSIESLKGNKSSMGSAGWVIMFHPYVRESAKEFWRVLTAKNNQNQFEIGLLLGYAEADVYAWCFGTDDAKKYYPAENFNKDHEVYSLAESSPWRKIGKNRLRKVIPPEEYNYVIAEYPPKGDPDFESSH